MCLGEKLGLMAFGEVAYHEVVPGEAVYLEVVSREVSALPGPREGPVAPAEDIAYKRLIWLTER